MFVAHDPPKMETADDPRMREKQSVGMEYLKARESKIHKSETTSALTMRVAKCRTAHLCIWFHHRLTLKVSSRISLRTLQSSFVSQ